MGFDTRLFGIIYFFTGILLAYFTYSFFSNLVTGFTTADWTGWAFIQAILWIGYGVSILTWIILIPFLTITRDVPVHPFTFLKVVGFLIMGVGFIYISYPLSNVLLETLDPIISSTDWDNFTYIFWIFYTGVMLLILVGAPLYCVFKEPENA